MSEHRMCSAVQFTIQGKKEIWHNKLFLVPKIKYWKQGMSSLKTVMGTAAPSCSLLSRLCSLIHLCQNPLITHLRLTHYFSLSSSSNLVICPHCCQYLQHHEISSAGMCFRHMPAQPPGFFLVAKCKIVFYVYFFKRPLKGQCSLTK